MCVKLRLFQAAVEACWILFVKQISTDAVQTYSASGGMGSGMCGGNARNHFSGALSLG